MGPIFARITLAQIDAVNDVTKAVNPTMPITRGGVQFVNVAGTAQKLMMMALAMIAIFMPSASWSYHPMR